MSDLNELQKEIFQNKVDRGFNTTDIGKEIVLMTEELGELAKASRTVTRNRQRISATEMRL